VNACRNNDIDLPGFTENPHLKWLFSRHDFKACLTALLFFDGNNGFLEDAVQELLAFNGEIRDELLMNEAVQLLSAFNFLLWLVKFHRFITEPITRESFLLLEHLANWGMSAAQSRVVEL
jgi:hypothetical protein